MRITLFSFILCCYYFIIYITHASPKCLEDQQSLLLQLKNNLTFYPEFSTKLILWNKSTACCNWSGVTCDNEGHIIGLDLSREYIHGGFDNSSSLFSLQHLQKLNMAGNSFNSLIPSGFNKLEKLTYLNLSEASFVGQIPIEISQLTRLVALDLSSYVDTKPKIPNLQKLIQNLTNMRRLYLDGISITSQGHEWINALLPLSDLQELSMSNCNLSGTLDSSLSKLENLSVIILGENNFSSPVPQTFTNFKNLTTLSLYDCGLTGTFPQKIFQIKTLSNIDLSENNNLQGSFLEFQVSGSLQTLRVRNTRFSGKIPNSVSNLIHLNYLDLSYNDFSGAIPSSLFSLRSLQKIQLSSNQFSKFDKFINVSSSVLKVLDLSSNNISGNFPILIFQLRSLSLLDLSSNRLNGSLQLDDLLELRNLTNLNLSYNNISGPFPTSIFQLRSLSFLDLSSNKLNGSLQLDELLKLRNLTILDLSYNNISINVNDENADQTAFPNLNFLHLASCKLKTFPNFLRNKSELRDLDLSDNQIQGKIPNWIWKLQDLETLIISHNFLSDLEGPLQNLTSNLGFVDLHNNKLQGSIPVFPKSAEFLDYSTNDFSVAPQDIGNYLPNTYFLSLSNNNLQGSIPLSLCNASHLQVLDISFNNISGTIPPCLITMTSTLEVLNLRNNNLNGTIPDMFPEFCVANMFPEFCVARTLIFHENLLHGPIPKSLSHCSVLKVLDIGSNQIVGGFPCFLKNMPNLSVLVLRNNKLHGPIECSHSLEDKPWNTIQIFDIALNNFNGKLPEKYFSTWERMMQDEDVILDFVHIDQTQYFSYYQDSVTVSNKGQQMKLDKILKIFTGIDFSSNHFEGLIPEVLMDLKAVRALNFSNNALSGEIPSSIWNLKQLESLDLSNNALVGEIPLQLASMSFLSYLNLSFNHLVGKIPTGTQLQSFQASSFEGNEGLYGPPLDETPNGKKQDELHQQPTCERLACSIDWNFLSVELGFVFGLGIIIIPLLFWKKWRVSYWKLVDKILCLIFQRMHFEYATDRGQTYRILRW